MNRPGWQTTEFWISAATILGLLIGSTAGSLPGKWAALAASISAGLYAIARGLAKLYAPPPPS